MKRTASTLMLLAGLSGGCMSTDGPGRKEVAGGYGTVTHGQQLNGYMGPTGEPVLAARAAAPSGVMTAGGTKSSGGVQQVALFRPYGEASTEGCSTCAHVPGMGGCSTCGPGGGGGYGGGYGAGGPPAMGGILPVPGMGPPGAVAGVGAMGVGASPAIPNGRASIKFTGPAGMKVTWQLPDGSFNDEASGLTAPKEYNFVQSQVYRLRLTQILPNHPGKSFYPTLEVAAANPKTVTFLAHTCVPITFTNDDFDQAVAGNLVVKVVYLPDRENQDFLTVGGIEEVNSTRLEPGVDPVAEAQRKGTILAIVRLGNIDLENRASPAMNAPPGGMPGGMMIPPGMVPPPPKKGPGAAPPGMSSISSPVFGGPMSPTRPTAPAIGTNPNAPTSLPPVR